MNNDSASRLQIESLYEEHSAALLLFALAITREKSRAQDAVHQVFQRLLESENLQHVADAKAYLFACVRNAALNDTRVRQREAVLEEQSAWFEAPARDYAEDLKLRRTLLALPEDQRQVIVLHIWGELTFSQIAGVMNISGNTAASRYRYALAKLQEAMNATALKEGLRAGS